MPCACRRPSAPIRWPCAANRWSSTSTTRPGGDPLICLRLAAELFPDRTHYGPIDAQALGRYRFFEKLGFFGVEAGTAWRRLKARFRGERFHPGQP